MKTLRAWFRFILVGAVVVAAGASPPASAHKSCRDHGRDCRWQDSAQALCLLDQAAGNYVGMGIGEDNENLREIRAEIVHHESDLRDNISGFEAIDARLEEEGRQIEERRRRGALMLDRAIADRDRGLAEMSEMLDDLKRDRCNFVVALVQVPFQQLSQRLRAQPGTERQRAVVDGVTGMLSVLCGEKPLAVAGDLHGQAYIQELTAVIDEQARRLLIEKGKKSLVHTVGRVAGRVADPLLLALQMGGAYLEIRQLERLSRQVEEKTEIDQRFLELEMYKAAEQARANLKARKDVASEIQQVRAALERRGCP
jgi:hypothetical protein